MSDRWKTLERTDRRAPRRNGRAARRVLIAILCAILCGCAGTMPSIPNSPETILAKGDQYFQRKKYYQSQELFKAFLTRFAGHDRSDYAQYMLAESYYGGKEYALAAVEYRVLVTNYGYSEYVDEGFFKEAVCSYFQSPKPELDQAKAFQALSQFQQFIQVYPQSPLVPEADKYIALIREKLAKKDMENAQFYFGQKRYLSALVYLDKIIQNYPGNVYWLRAKYLKAKIFYVRGERMDEAAELLRQVLDSSADPRLKRDADLLLKRILKE